MYIWSWLGKVKLDLSFLQVPGRSDQRLSPRPSLLFLLFMSKRDLCRLESQHGLTHVFDSTDKQKNMLRIKSIVGKTKKEEIKGEKERIKVWEQYSLWCIDYMPCRICQQCIGMLYKYATLTVSTCFQQINFDCLAVS